MNQNNSREIEDLLERYSKYIDNVSIGQYNDKGVNLGFKPLIHLIIETHHQELQKAREECLCKDKGVIELIYRI